MPTRSRPRPLLSKGSAAPIAGLPAVLALAAATLLGCREGQPREYSEINFEEMPVAQAKPPAMDPALMPPMGGAPVGIKVTWTLPGGWVVKDSAMGMRVGSFLAPDPSLANTGEMDPKAVDISVVQLAGEAGGLRPNIARWMGQVGLIATPQTLEDIITQAPKFKTKTGQEGIFVDLTDKLSGDMTQSKTIFGAVIATADYTVFVKGIGERERVIQNKKKIKTFSQSIAIAKGPGA